MISRTIGLLLTVPSFWLLSGKTAWAQDTQVPLADIVESWLGSPHADQESQSFQHWNEDGAVAQECAACHSSSGLRDFLGADGTEPGIVDRPALIGSTVDCAACHNLTATSLDEVVFPSGAVVERLGSSAICMVCHQGRQSSSSVEAAVAGLEPDSVSPDLGFINIHYRAAAASLMGAVAHGAYEYPGKIYAGRFAHVAGFDSCANCHDAHTLEVSTTVCASCHNTQDLWAIRTRPDDVDADGDASEGVAAEMATLHDALGRALLAYAAEVTGAPIIYAPDNYPYFFADLNANGLPDGEELAYPNRYQHWTPRLLQAAYNYQFVAKDPGIYAHNPAYAQQILIDSLDSLGEAVELETQVWTRP
ncbi:C-type polyheme cytochrome OmcB [Defluviimonas aquaemixtae]|uniref:C-type polyheme cytochrome OmcB n=1 Tax=Albidovulum aquaemixtae TaxID=1542388 RepID=A0A2R8B892_9RHOB|nr:polyheme membrane-associated cytochrome C [Defluviimonas aquaemixtae]SPH18804.1 C-type polyheme cytochrome OmcB [Defluviimonas aquaemixtae]